jgi:hypothetical protein
MKKLVIIINEDGLINIGAHNINYGGGQFIQDDYHLLIIPDTENNIDELTSFWGSGENCLMLHHSNQSNEINKFIEENSSRCHKGRHETNDDYYNKLKFLINNDTTLDVEIFVEYYYDKLKAELNPETQNLLNKKLTLLYKLLGNPLLTINELDEEEKELAKPYFELKYDKDNAKEDEKTARLRHLRDELLKDAV